MSVMRRLLAALGGYSENFMVALVLWPVASVALTLPILAYLYHRDGRLRFGSVASTYLAVLYALGLACFTLYPLPSGAAGPGISYGIPWQLNPLAPVGDIAREGFAAVPQILFNVVFFVPLGFIAGRMLRLRLVPSLALGLATSLLIEAAQGTGLFGVYPYAYRTADVDDLIYNTTGAALGWCCSAALGRVLPPGALAEEGEVTREPGLVRRLVAFWLDTLLVGLVSIVAEGALRLVVALLAQLPGPAPELAAGVAPWVRAAVPWLGAAAFVVVELVAPLVRGGSTPGGGFVRMSCETRERAGARRAAFYAARTAVLGLSWYVVPVVWPMLAIFWLFARRMPYDYV